MRYSAGSDKDITRRVMIVQGIVSYIKLIHIINYRLSLIENLCSLGADLKMEVRQDLTPPLQMAVYI